MKIILFPFLLLFNILSFSYDCENFIGYKESSCVFCGRVIKMEIDDKAGEVIVSIEKYETYKNNLFNSNDSIVVIHSLKNVAGYNWQIGETYLVFVDHSFDKNLNVNMCSLTTKIKTSKGGYCNYTGEYLGFPSLQEVKDWKLNNCPERKKWEQL